jgi:hypothetical protein
MEQEIQARMENVLQIRCPSFEVDSQLHFRVVLDMAAECQMLTFGKIP